MYVTRSSDLFTHSKYNIWRSAPPPWVSIHIDYKVPRLLERSIHMRKMVAKVFRLSTDRNTTRAISSPRACKSYAINLHTQHITILSSVWQRSRVYRNIIKYTIKRLISECFAGVKLVPLEEQQRFNWKLNLLFRH